MEWVLVKMNSVVDYGGSLAGRQFSYLLCSSVLQGHNISDMDMCQ